jgi:hypothetical protein
MSVEELGRSAFASNHVSKLSRLDQEHGRCDARVIGSAGESLKPRGKVYQEPYIRSGFGCNHSSVVGTVSQGTDVGLLPSPAWQTHKSTPVFGSLGAHDS